MDRSRFMSRERTGIYPDVIVPRGVFADIAGRGDLVVEAGRVAALSPAALTDRPRHLLPALVEPHCHLDKCHTIERIGPVGGDLAAAIDAQRGDKAHWTEADLRRRAARGLAEARAAGVGALRTHVDWTDTAEPPLAWSVIAELARDAPMTVQLAALVNIETLADKAICAAIARRAAGGVLGSFILDHPLATVEAGLRNLFTAADRHGLALDFHVDEGLGDHGGLERIADMALETGFGGPILCGHAVSLMNRAPGDVARIAGKLARAGIAVCALPTTNLYLQGRNGGTPDRRGITRLAELRAAGVRILVGSDNVGDAFCPVGAHDPMAALHLAVLAAHLDPPLERWLPAITSDAAAALGLPAPRLAGARPADVVLSDAATIADVVAGRFRLRPLDMEPPQ
jgi:cytosine deaminase